MLSTSRPLRLPVALLVVLMGVGACDKTPTGTEGDAETAPVGDESVRFGRGQRATQQLTERLGRSIFMDTNLSLNRNQACVSCHVPAWGFSAPDPEVNASGAIMEGSVAGRFGTRRPPSAAYATPSPVFALDPATGRPAGGNFWDGRATGERLGSPAAEQALRPFLNPVEQALPDAACVVYRVSRATYSSHYRLVWGDAITTIAFPQDIGTLCGQEGSTIFLTAVDREKVKTEFDHIALSIAAFEDGAKVNRFRSRFDLVGMFGLSPEERLGLELFEGRARCATCHPAGEDRPLFTTFGYANLGVPRNPYNPAYLTDPGFVDLGLGGVLGDPAQFGKMKIPTVRNVDKRGSRGAPKAFTHNGVFKSLEEVVHFYNTRDVLPRCEAIADPRNGVNCWPAPEVAANMTRGLVGDLGLNAAEERAIVAFLKTLTDMPGNAGWGE